MGRFSLFEFNWGGVPSPLSVERDESGGFFYEYYNNITGSKAKRWKSEKKKLVAILDNPHCFRALKMNADIFSIGHIDKFIENKISEKDFLYTVKTQPNFHQSYTEFFWEYCFWLQLGTAYMWRSSDVMNKQTQIQWLNPVMIDFGSSFRNNFNRFVFSQQTYKDLLESNIRYTWPDGKQTEIPLKQITPFFATSNGISENWFKGESTVDNLYKVIANSESGMDAKHSNLDFVQRYMLSSKVAPGDTSQLGLTDPEKKSIQSEIKGPAKVLISKLGIDIKRFVDNLDKLKLDDLQSADSQTIAAAFGIPKVLWESVDATFENQEKALARHVEYTLNPMGKKFTDKFEMIFNFQDLRYNWSDAMFNQVFETERATRVGLELANIQIAKEQGAITEQEARVLIRQIMNL